tara:strand:+ start:185 stop:745 length:561 start_codon:yes stop_codon:yes gene_type:complete
LIRFLIFVLALSACSTNSASEPKSFVARTDEGLRCAAFDYAAGLMVSSAHCLNGDRVTLSDGRTATVLAQGAFNSTLGDREATDRDIGLLLPSETRKPLARYKGMLEKGSILYLAPPDRQMIPCPLLDQEARTLFLSCRSEVGWSGSPIMRVDRFGRISVVGVLSAWEPDTGLSWATHISAVDAIE